MAERKNGLGLARDRDAYDGIPPALISLSGPQYSEFGPSGQGPRQLPGLGNLLSGSWMDYSGEGMQLTPEQVFARIFRGGQPVGAPQYGRSAPGPMGGPQAPEISPDFATQMRMLLRLLMGS